MVTYSSYPGITNDYVGVSTDTKPTDVPNGSTFYEMDTASMFMFDQEETDWLFQFSFLGGDDSEPEDPSTPVVKSGV